MVDNAYPPVEVSGLPIDLDNLHVKVDSITAGSIAMTAGTIKVTSGSVSMIAGTITSEVETIDYFHKKVHDGIGFHAGYYYGTVADGGTAMLSVAAGTVTPHIIWHISAGGNAELKFTEGGTITGGTAVTVFNKERGNAGSCLASANHSGTLTGGTVFYDVMVPGGSGPKPVGGQTRGEAEWCLLVSKTTTVEIINVSGAAFACSAGIDLYEEAI